MANFYDVALRFPKTNKVGQLRIEAYTPEQVREITSLMFPGATLEGYESLSLSASGQSRDDLTRLYKKIHNNGTIAEVNPKELSNSDAAKGIRFGGAPDSRAILNVMNLSESNSILQAASADGAEFGSFGAFGGAGGVDPISSLSSKWQRKISPEPTPLGPADRWSNDLQAMIDQETIGDSETPGAGVTFLPDQIERFKKNQAWVDEDLSQFVPKFGMPGSESGTEFIDPEFGIQAMNKPKDLVIEPGTSAIDVGPSGETAYTGDMPGTTNAQARYLKEVYFADNPDLIGTVHGHIMGINEFNRLSDDDKQKYGWRPEGWRGEKKEIEETVNVDGTSGTEIDSGLKVPKDGLTGVRDEVTTKMFEDEAALNLGGAGGEALSTLSAEQQLKDTLEGMSRLGAYREGIAGRFGGDLPGGAFQQFMDRQLDPYYSTYQADMLAGTGIPERDTFQDFVKRTTLPQLGSIASDRLASFRETPYREGLSQGMSDLINPADANQTRNALNLLRAAQQQRYSPIAARAFNPRGLHEEDIFADYMRRGGGATPTAQNFLEFAAGRYGL